MSGRRLLSILFCLPVLGFTQALVVFPPSITDSGQIGTTFGLSTSVTISSSNSTVISFSAVTQTSNTIGPNWLQISTGGAPATSLNGKTPATMTLTANLQGFAPGTYTAKIVITPTSSSSSGPQTITITLTAFGVDSLAVQYAPKSGQTMALTAGGAGSTGTVQVSAAAGLPLFFKATPTVISPSGGNWLQTSASSQETNALVTVSVQTNGLKTGAYSGRIDFLDSANVVETSVAVTLSVTSPSLLASPSSLSLSPTSGSTLPVQTISLTSSDSTTPVTIQSVVDDGVPWAVVTPSFTSLAGGTFGTPASLGLSINTSGLTAGQQYTDNIRVTANASNSPVTIPVTVNIITGVSQTIPHIADGAGWQTTIILVNLDTQPAQYAVNFWGDNGSAVSIPLAMGVTTGTIQPGGSTTIETLGSATGNYTGGWAEVISGQVIGGTAIFRNVQNVQEAAVPLLATGNAKVQIPFDSGGGHAIGVALANTSLTDDAQIAMTMRNEQGNTIPMTITNAQGTFSTTAVSNVVLRKHSHVAFNAAPLNATSEVRGVIEFDSPSVPIDALGIRGLNDFAFTSIEAEITQSASTKTISHIADGQGWQTTIVLVNLDTQAANYSLHLWGDNGLPASIPLSTGALSGVIQPGGSQTIATSGVGNIYTGGWAEVSSAQKLGGTAIFRDVTHVQEAAVPFLTNGGFRVKVPFDSGGQFAIGVAVVNPSQSTDAQISLIMRDQLGNVIPMTITNSQGNYSATAVQTLALPAHSHVAFNAKPLNVSGEISGTIEFDSNVQIFALGIRGVNDRAFTSIRAFIQ